jgi:hypothetical protein
MNTTQQNTLVELTLQAVADGLPVTVMEWSLGHLYTTTYFHGKLVLHVQRR